MLAGNDPAGGCTAEVEADVELEKGASTDPMTRPAPMPACRQCRARKVKCDRHAVRCGPCARLSISCSYSGSSVDTTSTVDRPAKKKAQARPHGTPESAGGLFSTFRAQPDRDTAAETHDYTEAGLKRQRARQACSVCRQVKVKCSGGSPCVRCRSRGLVCAWALDSSSEPVGGLGTTVPSAGNGQSRPPSASPTASPNGPNTHSTPWTAGLSHEAHTSNSSPLAVAENTPTPPETGLGRRWTGLRFGQLDKTAVRRYVDIYFDEPALWPDFPFLLKSLVLSDWNSGRLHPLLLKSIAASGLHASSRHGSERGRREDPLSDARAWMDEVWHDVLLHHFGLRPSLALVQTMVLLLRYYFHTGALLEMWNLTALAARFAFTLALNHENSAVDPTTQETSRRAVWAIYSLDRLFCGGIDDLAVCPAEKMHIRLPCSDRSFQRGIPSQVAFLESKLPASGDADDSHGMDMLAYCLRLLGNRHDILRFTKRICFQSTNPETTRHELDALRQGLDVFASALPAHLRNTPQNMVLMAHSPEANWFLSLHTLFLICHCDLYRHAVPGLREALDPATLQNSGPDYVATCQNACLDAAVGMCDLWDNAARLGFPANVSYNFFGIYWYHMAEILLRLRGRLVSSVGHGAAPDRDGRRRPSPADLAEKLGSALSLLHQNKSTATRLSASQAAHMRDTQSLVDVLEHGDPAAMERCLHSRPSGHGGNKRRYMPLRHTLLDTLTEEAPEEAKQEEEHAHLSSSSGGRTDERSTAAMPPVATAGFGAGQELVGMQEGMPWGDMNNYYDPILGDIFMSMTAASQGQAGWMN